MGGPWRAPLAEVGGAFCFVISRFLELTLPDDFFFTFG